MICRSKWSIRRTDDKTDDWTHPTEVERISAQHDYDPAERDTYELLEHGSSHYRPSDTIVDRVDTITDRNGCSTAVYWIRVETDDAQHRRSSAGVRQTVPTEI